MFTKMSEAIESYEQVIEDVHPTVELLGIEFNPVTLIKEVDPIAYREGFFDYMHSLEVDMGDLEDDADL